MRVCVCVPVLVFCIVFLHFPVCFCISCVCQSLYFVLFFLPVLVSSCALVLTDVPASAFLYTMHIIVNKYKYYVQILVQPCIRIGTNISVDTVLVLVQKFP